MATRDLPHRLDGALTIDHLAVGPAFALISTDRLDAAGLSDHDAYVTDLQI